MRGIASSFPMTRRLYGLKRIYFGGFFIRGRPGAYMLLLVLRACVPLCACLCVRACVCVCVCVCVWLMFPATMDTITFAVDYWGKGEIEALFLRHEGYIGT